MTSGIDIWGVVAGVIGIFGLIPMLHAFLTSQLPSTKLADLMDTVEETGSLFRSVTEEGLLKNTKYINQIRRQLHWIHVRSEDCQVASHRATTFQKQLRAMIAGLSSRISLLCGEAKQIRASLSEVGSIERKKLMARSGGVSEESLLNSIETHPQSYPIRRDATVGTTISRGSSDSAVDRDRSSVDLGPYLVPHTLFPEGEKCAEAGPQALPLACGVPSSGSMAKCDTSPLDVTSPSAHTPPRSMSIQRHKLRPYVPLAVQRILRHIDWDIAAQGQRHQVFARPVRVKHVSSSHHGLPVRCPDEKHILSSPPCFTASDSVLGIKVRYNDEDRDGDDEVGVIANIPAIYNDIPSDGGRPAEQRPIGRPAPRCSGAS